MEIFKILRHDLCLKVLLLTYILRKVKFVKSHIYQSTTYIAKFRDNFFQRSWQYDVAILMMIVTMVLETVGYDNDNKK